MQKGIHDEMQPDHPELRNLSVIHGERSAADFCFGIVASRFNPDLIEPLLISAVQSLRAAGATDQRILIVRVPGAFEIPSALSALHAARPHDAYIALGAVIEGETPHARVINAEVARGLREMGQAWQVPVIDGVVVARTLEQAQARCCSGEQSRGWYAAKAAVEMAHVMARVKA